MRKGKGEAVVEVVEEKTSWNDSEIEEGAHQ